MKLCRFELLSAPERIRSGLVYSGKIYETDGANPVGVHEAADVRPLAPVGRAPSIRFFRNPLRLGERLTMDEAEALPYQYGNPSSVVGPSQIVPRPDFANDLQFEPYLAAVVATPGRLVPVQHADDMLLGFTIVTQVVARDLVRRSESARGFDFATVLGPVLTTPEELDANVVDEEYGRRYKLSVVSRVNGVERRRADAADLPITFAQALSLCSQSAPLVEGDIIALGPIASWTDEDAPLESGDEIQVAVENLGTLSTKVGDDAPVEERTA
ncbi:MAG: fumarylacetoacetate hydrolase family protein [Fimbriimonadaceae bacterium]